MIIMITDDHHGVHDHGPDDHNEATDDLLPIDLHPTLESSKHTAGL